MPRKKLISTIVLNLAIWLLYCGLPITKSLFSDVVKGNYGFLELVFLCLLSMIYPLIVGKGKKEKAILSCIAIVFSVIAYFATIIFIAVWWVIFKSYN